jgi:hypothetical protein
VGWRRQGVRRPVVQVKPPPWPSPASNNPLFPSADARFLPMTVNVRLVLKNVASRQAQGTQALIGAVRPVDPGPHPPDLTPAAGRWREERRGREVPVKFLPAPSAVLPPLWHRRRANCGNCDTVHHDHFPQQESRVVTSSRHTGCSAVRRPVMRTSAGGRVRRGRAALIPPAAGLSSPPSSPSPIPRPPCAVPTSTGL